MYELRGVVDPVRIVGRHMDRCDPLETERQVSRIVTVDIPKTDIVLLLLTSSPIVKAKPTLAVGINDGRVAGLGDDWSRLAPSM